MNRLTEVMIKSVIPLFIPQRVGGISVNANGRAGAFC